MTFNEFKYERVNFELLEAAYNNCLEEMKEAANFEAFEGAVQKLYQLRNDFDTMSTLASVRFSIDMNDPFYSDENNFYDEVGPIMEGKVSKFYETLLASPFVENMKEKYGEHLINLATLTLSTFSEAIIEDLQEENRLNTLYGKLVGNAKIPFKDGVYNLSTMTPFLTATDREERKAAQLAVTAFFEDNEAEFDRIFDELVKLRHKMAETLGFSNYVELGYAKMNRTDYTASDVVKFREQVLEHIVPLRVKLNERQAKRLGLETMKYYDSSLTFLTGNAKPAGDEAWMVEKAKKMYHELSPETDEFFTFMTEGGLLDLSSRDGKRPGGYCTYIPNYKSPFIFANFNGTTHDVEVLTHEAGHALQVYLSRGYEFMEYQWPTYEACEIHSMSMEYLTYPWMKEFFEADYDKFIFSHSSQPIKFIPYGVTVDEFQHWVYEHPEATPAARKQAWVDIESKYMPDIDYEDNDFLKRGGFWFRQGHIFRTPFYYIDYTLALTCAVQFFVKATNNREEAWSDYVRLCKEGGSKPFTELLKVAKLGSPFEEGTVASVIYQVQDILDNIDDSRL